MAKDKVKDKAKKPAAGSPAAKAEAAASFKYGVSDVAEKTGLKPTSIRVAFRKNGIKKAEGGVYGWNTKDELDAVIAEAFPAKKEKAEKPAKAAKSAKKKKAKDADED